MPQVAKEWYNNAFCSVFWATFSACKLQSVQTSQRGYLHFSVCSSLRDIFSYGYHSNDVYYRFNVRTHTHTYQVGVIPQSVEVHKSAKHGSNIKGFVDILQPTNKNDKKHNFSLHTHCAKYCTWRHSAGVVCLSTLHCDHGSSLSLCSPVPALVTPCECPPTSLQAAPRQMPWAAWPGQHKAYRLTLTHAHHTLW